MSIKKEINAVILLSTLLLGGLCIAMSLFTLERTTTQEIIYLEDILLEERMNQLRDLVANAVSVVDQASFYEDAQRAINDMRFGEKSQNYFFVFDTDGMFFVHPGDPGLVGKVRNDLKDADGSPYIREIIDRARNEGSGFIRFQEVRRETGNPATKLALFRIFPEWNWIVGAGMFIDDIDAAVAAKKAEIRTAFRFQVIAFLGILAGCLLIGFFVSSWLAKKRIITPILELAEIADEASLGRFDRKIRVKGNKEVAMLADAIERLKTSLEKSLERLNARSHKVVGRDTLRENPGKSGKNPSFQKDKDPLQTILKS